MGLARYADRGYTRLLLRLGLAVAAAGMLWFGLATQLWEFIGARLLLGLGSGMFVPAARRVVVARSGAKAGEALGRLASVEVAGFISGPPIAALLAACSACTRRSSSSRLRSRSRHRRSRGSTSRRSGREPPKRALRVLVANRGVRSGLALAAALYLSIGVFDATWARVHDGPRGEHDGHRGHAGAVRAPARRAEPVRRPARGPPGAGRAAG